MLENVPATSQPLAMFFKVDDHFYRSALPGTPAEFDHLKAIGITTILSLEPLSPPAREYALAGGFKIRQFPLPDGFIPTSEQVAGFLEVVREALGQGETILLHCMAGRDRTGLMTGFYLIRFRDMDPFSAYWEADKRFLGDNPEFKDFLLTHGQVIREQSRPA